MLRILHSLPRVHKYLLLPVATMVTVLGAHKLLETLDSQEISPASRHLAIDLANASSEVTNALPVAIAHAQQTPAPLATAWRGATLRADAE
ncbi:hypothetical protein CU110_13315 [Cobetia sp. ICG0124]|nr:hypothetical protein CU110_13315 [Cobetia sp. ICG0124]